MSNEDFTHENYRKILETAKSGRSFEPFGTEVTEPHVLWRHDVDFSIHRSAKLAKIEADMGVNSTYFIQLTSEFYNVFEASIRKKIDEILGLNHWIGLHFDFATVRGGDTKEIIFERMAHEKDILDRLFGIDVKVVSYHNPEYMGVLDFTDDYNAGMINTYGKKIKEKYTYGSDSNGIWRHTPIHDLVADPANKYLQILTHPIWWVEHPAAPRQRLVQAAVGRSDNAMKFYDDLLEKMGRPNIR